MTQFVTSDYALYEKLLPRLSLPGFDQYLNKVLPQQNKTKRFLFKMELQRLARPCMRVIDLRKLLGDKCQIFEFQGRFHAMDERSIDRFERLVKLYGGYTQGVYETILHETANQLPQIEGAADQDSTSDAASDAHSHQYMADALHFRRYEHRKEERMNFAVALDVELPDGIRFNATSIDLSVNGLQIKTRCNFEFPAGQVLKVHFTGLEKDYVFGSGGVAYAVVQKKTKKEFCYLSLCRDMQLPNPRFDDFLETLITENKRRYKVNLDNTLISVQVKGFEQYYATHTSSLPIFIQRDEWRKAHPRFALLNDYNKALFQYLGADDDNGLSGLFTDRRIERWFTNSEHLVTDIVYSFNLIRDGKRYWCSATGTELKANPQLRNAFLGFGSLQDSWRVYLVQACLVNNEQAHSPSSLPATLLKEKLKKEKLLAPKVQAQIQQVSHMLTLTDITLEHSTQAYQQFEYSKADLRLLRGQTHPRNEQKYQIEGISFQYRSLRQESRYKLNSPVSVVVGKKHKRSGTTVDISSKGIKVMLDKPIDYHAEVRVSFPGLQELTRKYKLKDIAYEMVKFQGDKKQISLKLDLSEYKGEQTSRFFTELIDRNRRKLSRDLEHQSSLELGEALKNLFLAFTANPNMYFSRQGTQFVPDSLAVPSFAHPFVASVHQDNPEQQADLSALFTGPRGRVLQDALKANRADEDTLYLELLALSNPEQPGNISNWLFANELQDAPAKQAVVEEGMQKGNIKAYRLTLKKTGKPDISAIESELRYITVYAVHKAKAIEERLWNIRYLCEIQDISEEFFLRYDLIIKEKSKVTDTDYRAQMPQMEGTWQQASNNTRSLSNS
ncbi:PilZ domain-containing protein [Aliiglaciecola sp. CAU 1673]|uniref:PilZ domain-containing protein n=1 Tax=Aliiglaciecola sp. CAU 1673 TaxID=3032595 RepID=UPI0023DC9887|nr:PilZ domain-containing protein [Aliiglaciecola sp. CAU 1673]MDF2178009.1 PilZ domain-containing protein [Aliiglaciecola sp. CAU 1673]